LRWICVRLNKNAFCSEYVDELRFQAGYASGSVDYTGSGLSMAIHDYMYELRGLIAKSLSIEIPFGGSHPVFGVGLQISE